MKKIICILLSMLSCCVFASAASAEGQGETLEVTTSATEAATTTTTVTTTTTTQAPPASQLFSGTVKISCDNKPVNTDILVTISVEGGTLTESDRLRYRLYNPTVSMSDAEIAASWTDYTAPVSVSENTAIEAAVFFGDGSRSAAVSHNITCIDKTAPTPPQITPSTTEWTREAVEVSLSGGSDGQSGLLRLEYRVGEDGSWAEYTDKVSVSSAGTFYARSVDAAGNVSEASVLEIKNFDITPPDVKGMSVVLSSKGSPVIADSGAFSKYYGGDVTAKADGAQDNESGVASYQYQLVSGTEAVREDGWKSFDAANPPAASGDFCGYVYFRAVDRAGNASAAVASEGFVIDTVPPVISNIKLSEEKVTGNRVVVTFTVTDNYGVETVLVNGNYAGVYVSSFTAFRNDDYLIVAFDKVGNRVEEMVKITNINSTPFTLLNTWKNMDPQDFTPTTWAVAERAANELETLITLNSPQTQIEAAAGRLLTALEGLVTRGDATLSRELIERLNEYDSELYTESSWNNMQEAVAALEAMLDNPESTQEAVDSARRDLEQKVAELVKRADFTDLDRLISQCERIDTSKFSSATYAFFTEALNNAKELSRTDSGQAEADAAYENLLAAMGGLEVYEKAGLNFAPVVFVILGLLIVASGTALFIIRMRQKAMLAEETAEEEEETVEEDGEYSGYGDIHFTDEEASEPEAPAEEEPTYIGGRGNKKQ